jgi:hypothetical protein
MERGRAVLAPLLVVVGVGLVAYGFFHNSIAVLSKPPSPPVVTVSDGEPTPVQAAPQVQPTSEAAVVQEVARGGVTRDESGQIKKTYEGTEAPKACPT